MRLRTLCLLIIALALTSCKHPAPMAGYWTGSMEMNGRLVDIETDFRLPTGSFSSRDLMIVDAPVQKVVVTKDGVSFSSDFGTEAVFEGKLAGDRLAGAVHLQGAPPSLKVTFALTRRHDPIPEKTYAVERQTVAGNGVRLAAEIYKPKSDGPHPALVLLHGSSTNLRAQYTYYADYFANLGFEVLIFDKRGSGESTGDYATATFVDLAGDAVTCLEALKARGSVDKAKIGLWGFSQGAMLSPLIAAKTDIPAFLIAVSAETVSTTEAAAFSDGKRLLAAGLPLADAQVAAESHRTVAKMIRAGSSAVEVESYIRQNAGKHRFMEQTGLGVSVRVAPGEFESYYWKGRTEDFSPYWKRLTVPVLAIYGEDDEFVDALGNVQMIQDLNNAKITTKVFPRANHSLRKANDPAKYPDYDWPRVAEGYPEFVKGWLKNRVSK